MQRHRRGSDSLGELLLRGGRSQSVNSWRYDDIINWNNDGMVPENGEECWDRARTDRWGRLKPGHVSRENDGVSSQRFGMRFNLGVRTARDSNKSPNTRDKTQINFRWQITHEFLTAVQYLWESSHCPPRRHACAKDPTRSNLKWSDGKKKPPVRQVPGSYSGWQLKLRLIVLN